MEKKLGFIITLLVLTTGAAFAAPNYDYSQNSAAPQFQQNYYPSQTLSGNQTLKGRVVTVPAGQSFQAVVTTPLNSANLTTGQSVSIALGSDFYYNGNLIAPAGSVLNGRAINTKQAGFAMANGQIGLLFDEIMTPDGNIIPLKTNKVYITDRNFKYRERANVI